MTALRALILRELLGFIRRPSRIVATIGTPALVWVFLAAGFAGAAAGGAPSFGAYAAPGIALLVAVFGGLIAGMGLIQDRRDGFLAGVFASPTPRRVFAAAKVSAAGFLATVQGGLILAALPTTGWDFNPIGLIAALLALTLGALGVCGLSLAAASRIDSPQGFHGVMNLLIMPMWLLSGALTPLDNAHGVFRMLADLNPLRWCHAAMLGSLNMGEPSTVAWVIATAFALAGCGTAVLALGSARRTR